MNKYIVLAAVTAACTLAGCVSYSSTTRTVPAPAQPTVYADTTTAPASTTTVYTTR